MPATPVADWPAQLDALCDHLEAEAERQVDLLEATRAQARAAQARDVALLEERTRAMSLLIEQTVAAEAERVALLRAVVATTGLAEDAVTLSALIAAVPEPWKGRMAEFQQRMRGTLVATRQVVRENQVFLQRTARAATTALEAVTGSVPARGGAYNHRGNDGPREGRPSLLDQQG